MEAVFVKRIFVFALRVVLASEEHKCSRLLCVCCRWRVDQRTFFKCEPLVIVCLQRANNDIERAKRYLDDPLLAKLQDYVEDETFFDPGMCRHDAAVVGRDACCRLIGCVRAHVRVCGRPLWVCDCAQVNNLRVWLRFVEVFVP